MTDYADMFTKVQELDFGAVYHWRGWEIYWDYTSDTGQLYNADDYCIGTADEFEMLVQEAVARESSR